MNETSRTIGHSFYRAALIGFAAIALIASGGPAWAKGKTQIGKWKAGWDEMKDEYEKLSGNKKPSEKVLLFFRKPAGIDKALETLDGAHKAMAAAQNDDKKFGKAITAYEKALNDFSSKKDDYMKLLLKEIGKATDADEQLLIELKQELRVIEGSAKQQLDFYSKKQGGSDNIDATFSRGMIDSLGSMIAQAKQFAAGINAEKDKAKKAEMFNKKGSDIARDLTTPLGNIIKSVEGGSLSRGEGRTVPKIDVKGDPPKAAYTQLSKWADEWKGGGAKVDATTVEAELDNLMTQVKIVDTWFKQQ